MKNIAIKNLIFLFVFAISIFGMNYAVASADIYYNSGYPYGYGTNYSTYTDHTGGYDTDYAVRNNYVSRQQTQMEQYAFEQQQLQAQAQLSQQQYYNDQQKLIQEQNLAIQKQNIANMNNSQVSTAYLYAQPKVQYIAQPTTTQVQYVAQPAPVSYIPANTQGASVLGSTNKVVYTNTGIVKGTGQYVSYDANGQAASVYGYNGYNNAQVVSDPNGVAALSMNGSGGFMPSSVFQWFMFILLMLAIIIVARLIIRKRALNNAHTVPTH